MGRVSSVLFSGGAVLTVSGQTLPSGFVYVEDDRIAQVGDGDPPIALRRSAGEHIDCANKVVMPGLINAHTHLFQTLFRGMADDKPLLEWLQECIWPVAGRLTAEDVEAATLLGLVENIRSGVTSVIDHQYVHSDPDTDQSVCLAAQRVGLRFVLARGWADRNYHPPLIETHNQVIERTAKVADRFDDGDLLTVENGPLIPWGCSDQAMETTTAAVRSRRRGIHVHCAETAEEVAMSVDERGLRHVEWLESLGQLGPDCQLAHSVWLDNGELDSIARHQAVVVHCPVSNMYLASGVARIREMLDRGIPVALGTDGPGSNNRQDMFEVLKTTVLLQKVSNLEAMILQPEDALSMACRGGARAMQRQDLGTIDVGMKADLTVVDLSAPFVAPVHRVASALVFCCTPADVVAVMVNGRLLMRDRQLLTVDESAIVAAAEQVRQRLFT